MSKLNLSKPTSPKILYGFTQLSYGRRLLLLTCVFVMMLVISGFSDKIARNLYIAGTREYLNILIIFQNIIAFCGTAIITAIFVSTKPLTMLGINCISSYKSVIGVVLLFALGIPFLNQLIFWNNNLQLPSFFHDWEIVMQQMEQTALNQTNTMLNTISIGGLIVSILIVGVLTGFSEELLFRGTLQRIIASNGLNKHLSIWLTAFIFSLIHFQFYGFFPRMLLGAFFGYIFMWTGSIWVAAFAHILNNSIYVVYHWFENNNYNISNIENIGVTEKGFPIFAIISLTLVLITLCGFHKTFFPRSKKQ